MNNSIFYNTSKLYLRFEWAIKLLNLDTYILMHFTKLYSQKVLKKWTLKMYFPRFLTLVLKQDSHNTISHNTLFRFPLKTCCAGTPCTFLLFILKLLLEILTSMLGTIHSQFSALQQSETIELLSRRRPAFFAWFNDPIFLKLFDKCQKLCMSGVFLDLTQDSAPISMGAVGASTHWFW